MTGKQLVIDDLTFLTVSIFSNDDFQHPELDQDGRPGAAGDGGAGGARPQAPVGERLRQQDQTVPQVCPRIRRELLILV